MTEFSLQRQAQSLISSDPAAIAAAEGIKARIQAAYIMALQKPRNEDQARARILAACKRPAFAERVEFAKPVANRKIKGPSIRFAELALREWENIYSDISVIYEDHENKRIKISVLDLETNASFTKEITIKKTVERKNDKGREVVAKRLNTYGDTVYVVMATEDELNNKENALISKTLRNEGLRLIPSDIVDEAIEIARKTMTDKYGQDPKAEKKKVLDAFATIGVYPKEIEQYLKHSLDAINPNELQDLRGIYRAIRDGEQNWSDYVTSEEKEKKDTGDVLKSMANDKPTIKPEPFEEVTATPPEPEWYDAVKWINLKTTGFTAWLHDYADELPSVPSHWVEYKKKSYLFKDAITKKASDLNIDLPYSWFQPPAPSDDSVSQTKGYMDAISGALKDNPVIPDLSAVTDRTIIEDYYGDVYEAFCLTPKVNMTANLGQLSDSALTVLLNMLRQEYPDREPN